MTGSAGPAPLFALFMSGTEDANAYSAICATTTACARQLSPLPITCGQALSVTTPAAPQVNINRFKGATYVAIREYYEKGGQLLPGAKGMNLNLDGWHKVVAGMRTVEALMQQA